MNAVRFISFWTGFCSLSLEIAWIRLYGYANQSTPKAFAYVLVIYLLGIAAGAHFGKKICKFADRSAIEKASIFILAVCAFAAATAPWAFIYAQKLAFDKIAAPLGIFLTAASLSVLFPITHHLGTPQGPESNTSIKGQSFSRVYLANVFGAALGPVVTGYILLEYLTIAQVFALLALTIGLVAVIGGLLFRSLKGITWIARSVRAVCIVFVAANIAVTWRDPDYFSRELAIVDGLKVVTTFENRHGIITITERPPSKRQQFTDHVVYGGNVYDGKVNVDMERNTNGLERPLALHVLQPSAKKVLVLGLSIGSWLTVVEGFPGVEKIDVIEINPGYLKLAQNYDPQRRALEDPRVTVIIDDARRWLQYHPEHKYDLILMNTTWHWRANSSMLLSQEMMTLLSRHLSTDGVLTFNATGSPDAFYTASTVFPEVRRYQNFIYGANWNAFLFANDKDAWNILRKIAVDGRPAFNPDSKKISTFAAIPFVKLEEDLIRLDRAPEIITDDNMLVEYKYGKKH